MRTVKTAVRAVCLSGAVLAPLSLLSGCATTEGYRQTMDLMVGFTTDQLLIEWGVPYAKSTLTDGTELWAYRKIWTERSPASWSTSTSSYTEKYKDKEGVEHKRYTTYTQPEYSAESISEHRCDTRFVINADKTVKGVIFRGDCKALKPKVQAAKAPATAGQETN